MIFFQIMPFCVTFSVLFVDFGSFCLCHTFSFRFWVLEGGYWFFLSVAFRKSIYFFVSFAFLVQDHFFGSVRGVWFHFLLFCKNRMLRPEAMNKWIIGRRIYVIFIFSLLLFVFFGLEGCRRYFVGFGNYFVLFSGASFLESKDCHSFFFILSRRISF